MNSFVFYRTPRIVFGNEVFFNLPNLLSEEGFGRIVLITGNSFMQSEFFRSLSSSFESKAVSFTHYLASGEPSPDFVDMVCGEQKPKMPDAVIAVGGGSVIDAGKAVSAMLKAEGQTRDYLEGVGTKKPNGKKAPFFAVPTTAGTGTEASKNSVLSKTGQGGFKKSLRHDNYTPDVAIVDPSLTLTCPRDVTAYSGMDAVTQLIEAFVSVKSDPLSDSAALSGIMTAGHSLEKAVRDGDDLEARSGMSYAALMSGIAMANSGLGLVHGLASPIGAAFPIPHGVVCGTLLAETTAAVVNKLFDHEEENNAALLKYAEIGKYLALTDAGGFEENCEQLLNVLDTWTEEFDLPRLSAFGVKAADLPGLVAKAGHKESPAVLDTEEILEILKARL